MNKISSIPTHFKFKCEKEAKNWNRTLKDWIPIKEINSDESGGFHVSSATFAWVYWDLEENNLEFKSDKYTKKDLREFEST